MRKLEFRDYSCCSDSGNDNKNYNQITTAVREHLQLDQDEQLDYVVKNKGEKQYIFCFYYNNEILEVDDDEYDQIINKIRLISDVVKIDTPLPQKSITSIFPAIVKSMMSIEPIYSDKYFHHRHNENINQINNYELPKHRVMKEDKFNLANIIINIDINLSHQEINDCIVHNQMPFRNYKQLKDNLELYYDQLKHKDSLIHKYVYEDQENACLDVIESKASNYPSPLLVKEGDNYIVYSKIRLEHKDMRTDKDVSAFYVLNPNEEDKHKHHCFDMFVNKDVKKSKMKIKEIPKIDINPLTSHSVELKIIYEGNILKIDSFYLPEEDEIFLRKGIEKVWSRGLFLTNFGQEYYKNEKKILTKTMCVPEWFESTSDEQFRDLMIKISKL